MVQKGSHHGAAEIQKQEPQDTEAGTSRQTFSLDSLHTASPSQACSKLPASTTWSGGP